MFRIDEIRSLNIDGIQYFPTFQLGSRHIFAAVGMILIIVLIKDLLLKKLTFWRSADKALLAFSVSAILSISMLPIMILQHRDYFENVLGYGRQRYYATTNLFNLPELLANPGSRFQIVGNLVLLVPWVVCIALLYRHFRSFPMMLILAFLTSVTIEITQLVLNYYYYSNRVFDFGDIVNNTFGGAILGYICFQLVRLILPSLITDKPVK